MIFQIDNGVKVTTKTIEIYHLWLPSNFRLDLKDCYFIPVASRNLIFVFVLAQDGFEFSFNKNFCSIYLWNKSIVRGLLVDSLYHLHVDANMNLNEQIVSAVGQKRSRDEINQKYLWHHRLGYIKGNRINKLKKDGIFSSFDSESYLACESCHRKKWSSYSLWDMEKEPSSYLPWYISMCVSHLICRSEVIIATSLSLPMIYHDKDVYLIKDKSKAFEKFKKFRNEVEK